MRTLLQTLFFILLVTQMCFAQLFESENHLDTQHKKFIMKSHDPNLISFPEKSFYKQKADWQYIIDTTWGPGLPLAQKQQIFNMLTSSMSNTFDGFLSLGMTQEIWDSIKNYYYSKIDSTTSRGGFSAIITYLCSKMRDGHTYADDIEVITTLLNPGTPLLVSHGIVNAKHLGAVTTVLPDSSVLILRVVDNHPLNLEPGDIILGYEGVPWKDLIVELMEAGLPNYDWWGGYEQTFTDQLFIGAGMNWHLFDTMDILKYSTGDTVHLSVSPLVSLNVPSMLNNEQMEINNIPFPDFFNDEVVSYGILSNTNIGYIYVMSEYRPSYAGADQQFNDAVIALQNTDALIIDIRFNEGGSAFWYPAFNILSNQTYYTLEYVERCNPSNFNLCSVNLKEYFKITGSAPTKYDGPIAVLLGPNCISCGEINARRLKTLYNVKTFGKPTWGSYGSSQYPSFPGWDLRHSIQDIFYLNNPGVYFNRAEFPIDFPVWHNRDDVAMGKDAVVEKALYWINNLVYAHNTITDKTYYSPGEDTVRLSTIIENPNSHQLSVRAYIKTVEGIIVDSVDLFKQTVFKDSETWNANVEASITEEIYKVAITTFDETVSDQFTVPNAIRFTTAGPVKVDSLLITYNPFPKTYRVRPFVRNEGQTFTVKNLTLSMSSNDTTIIYVTGIVSIDSLHPGEVVLTSSFFTVKADSNFSIPFRFNFTIKSNGWVFWRDSISIVTNVEEEQTSEISTEFLLSQNYPNPFNPSTKIKYSIPQSSKVVIKVFDILGNEIETLVNEEKPAGTYELTWNAVDLPSGVYFYQLKAGDYIQTKKMILMK